MNLFRRCLPAFAAIPFLLASGCGDRNPTELEVGRAPADPLVFDDAYNGVYFQPFFETHYTAAKIDSVFAYDGFAPDGAKSLKFEIAPMGSALAAPRVQYSGGVLTPPSKRDLTDYNALTFYARSNADGIKMDVVGFGNDNTGTSRYEAAREEPFGITLTREWQFYVVPIPDPSRLISERGLFTIVEANEDDYPEGHNIWFDEIRFANLDGLTVQGSGFQTRVTRRYFTGMTVGAGAAASAFQYPTPQNPTNQIRVNHSSGYYDLESSNSGVASIDFWGDIHIVGVGEATITGQLRGVAVGGNVEFATYDPPLMAADAPTDPASDVVSLFSDAYDDVLVDTFKADWLGVTTQVMDYEVAGDACKLYYDMNYFGIELYDEPVDASQMNYLHLDVYAPAGTKIEVGITCFSEVLGAQEGAAVTLNAATTPAFESGQWLSLDIPLSDFPTSETWNWERIEILSLAQGSSNPGLQLMLVDNVYWHK